MDMDNADYKEFSKTLLFQLRFLMKSKSEFFRKLLHDTNLKISK